MPATTLDVIVQMNIQAAKSELMKLSKIVNMMNQNVLDQNTDVGKYKKLQKAAKNYNSVVEDLGKNHPISQQARAEMDGFIKQLKITKGETTKLLHNNKKFKFDFLTLLFVGMMLTKTFGGMFRNIIDSYKKITGLHSVFNKSLLKLQAGFGYLKFAIANALNSPGIIKAIEWFTNAIVWLGDYLLEHPTLSQAILAVIAALVTIGTLASIASGLIQMSMLIDIASATKVLTAGKNLEALGGGTKLFAKQVEALGAGSFSGLIIGVTGVIAIFSTLFGLLNNDKSTRDWTVDAISSVVKFVITLVSVGLQGFTRFVELGEIAGDFLFRYWKQVFNGIIDTVSNAFKVIQLGWKGMTAFLRGEDT